MLAQANTTKVFFLVGLINERTMGGGEDQGWSEQFLHQAVSYYNCYPLYNLLSSPNLNNLFISYSFEGAIFMIKIKCLIFQSSKDKLLYGIRERY